MIINHTRYLEISSTFKAQQCDDSPAVWQGLILGLCAKAISPDDRLLRELTAKILNDGQPLPGALSALATELALEAVKGLKKNELTVLLPAGSNAERLKALSGLCYGLTLGLTLNADGTQESSSFTKVKDPLLLDFLRTLQEVQRVDEEAELDEESLKTVLDYIEDNLCAMYDSFSD